MLPARFEPYVFGLLLSGLMSFMVSGVATARALGIPEGFFGLWLSAWIPSWSVAFPALLIARPFVARMVKVLIKKP